MMHGVLQAYVLGDLLVFCGPSQCLVLGADIMTMYLFAFVCVFGVLRFNSLVHVLIYIFTFIRLVFIGLLLFGQVCRRW